MEHQENSNPESGPVSDPIFKDEVLPPKQMDEGGPPILRDEKEEFPRTVGRPDAACYIKARFRLKLIDPRDVDPTLEDSGVKKILLFSQAKPELTLTSNGIIAIQVKVEAVGPFPGSLSFSFTRTAPGAPNPTAPGPFAANDLAGLLGQLKKTPQVELDPPPGMGANLKTVVETVTATVTWTPQGAQGCSITEEIRLVWNFASAAAVFEFALTTPEQKTPKGTTIAHGKTIARKRYKNGTVRYAVVVENCWVVKDPNACCGAKAGYSVIQFVRHVYSLNENPKREGSDKWTLDILDSEAARARGGQDYDPTFTQNPRTSPAPDPLVYPGPDTAGGASIVQVDQPGMDPALYDRFLQAGGTFSWQFFAFLVCTLVPGGAAVYLQKGKVSQAACFEIDVTFPGNRRAPTVSGNLLFGPKEYHPCESFKKILDDLDKKNGKGLAGKMVDGYNSPRGHQVSI